MRSRIRRSALTPRGRARRREIAEQLHALAARPLISVVMPTYETDPRYLREAIDSVRNQRYPDWELCVADDGSRSSAVRAELERARAQDARVKPAYLERNVGIAAATNAALELASGEYVAFLDHDDVLSSDALLRVVEVLGGGPRARRRLLGLGQADRPRRARRPVLQAGLVAGLRARRDVHRPPAGRPPLARRARRAASIPPSTRSRTSSSCCACRSDTERIRHLPRILYHWRAIPGSIAAGTDQKAGVPELQARAVTAHLDRLGAAARAVAAPADPAPGRARPGSAPHPAAGGARCAGHGDRRLERRRRARPPARLAARRRRAPPGGGDRRRRRRR